ncbi:MAG TPA: GNAT family N-acetyltransferase [Terriglobales bacterium]|nr:GNAT family N-acetyltransferase [Terriglobales bacterium]
MAFEFFTPNGLSASNLAEVTAFLDSQNTGHPFQFPQWAAPQTRFAARRESGRIVWFSSFGVQPLLGSRLNWPRAARLNRGPVCDDEGLFSDSLNEFAEQMRREKAVYVDAAPERPLAALPDRSLFDHGWSALDEGRFSMRLDVTKAAEEILARFRPTTRYKVRKAERAEVQVRAAVGEEDAEEFLQLYARTVISKGFPADRPDHLRGIIRWLIAGPARGALLLAWLGSAAVGGAVIVRSGRRCWYVWGANDRREDFSVGHLVQWHAILWAKAQGCTEYDFGGYTPGAISGPAFFKEGFSGEPVHFVPIHRKVVRPALYPICRMIPVAR